MEYWVYIMASKRNGVIYTGVTSNLERRVWEHKNNVRPGFTSKYFVRRLVWRQSTDGIDMAIQREKQIKKWKREWKIRLIEEENSQWFDLSEEW
jgi:putative endonuclease